VAANTNIQIPFTPQTGLTEQILAAIQLANVHHAENVRNQLLSQQNHTVQAGFRLRLRCGTRKPQDSTRRQN
jgi:hypothetical protein